MDSLTGSAGTDWFLANVTGSGVLDQLVDLNNQEIVTELDPIVVS